MHSMQCYSLDRLPFASRQSGSSWNSTRRLDSANSGANWTANAAAAYGASPAVQHAPPPRATANYRRDPVDVSHDTAVKLSRRERIREFALVNGGSGVVQGIDFESQLFDAEPITPSTLYAPAMPAGYSQSRGQTANSQPPAAAAKNFSTPAPPATSRLPPTASASGSNASGSSNSTHSAAKHSGNSAGNSSSSGSRNQSLQSTPRASSQSQASGSAPPRIKITLPRAADSTDVAANASVAIAADSGNATRLRVAVAPGDVSRRVDGAAPSGSPDVSYEQTQSINAILKEMIPSPLPTPIKDTDYRPSDSSSFKYPDVSTFTSSRQSAAAAAAAAAASNSLLLEVPAVSRKTSSAYAGGADRKTTAAPDTATSPFASRDGIFQEVNINDDLELSDEPDSSSSEDDDDDDDDEHDAFNKQVDAVKFVNFDLAAAPKNSVPEPDSKTPSSRHDRVLDSAASQSAETKRSRPAEPEPPSNGISKSAPRELKATLPRPGSLSNVGLSRVQELEDKLKQDVMSAARVKSRPNESNNSKPPPVTDAPKANTQANDTFNQSLSAPTFDNAWSLSALIARCKPSSDSQVDGDSSAAVASDSSANTASQSPAADAKISSNGESGGLKLKLPNPKSSDAKKRSTASNSGTKPPPSPQSRAKSDRPPVPLPEEPKRVDRPSFDDLPVKTSTADSPAPVEDSFVSKKIKQELLEAPPKNRSLDQKPAGSLTPSSKSSSRVDLKPVLKAEPATDLKPSLATTDVDMKPSDKKRKQRDTDTIAEEPAKRSRTEKAVATLEETIRLDRARTTTSVPSPLAPSKSSLTASPVPSKPSVISDLPRSRALAVSFPLALLSREQRERLACGDRPRTPTTFPKQPPRSRDTPESDARVVKSRNDGSAHSIRTADSAAYSATGGSLLSTQAALTYHNALAANAFVALQNGDVRNLMASPDELLRRLAAPETLHSAGREMKHAADAIRDNQLQRVVTYLRSVLHYISSLCAMEFHDANLAQHRFSMCFDMTGLVKHVKSLIDDLKNKRVVASRDAPSNGPFNEPLTRKILRVLSVVCARLQAGLHFKMYSLKKDDVARTRCAIDEYKSISSLPASNELFRHTHASPGGVGLAATAPRGTAAHSLQHASTAAAAAAALSMANGGPSSSQCLSARSTTPDYGLNASPASPYRHHASPAQIEQYLLVNAAATAAAAEPTGVLSSGAVCSSASSVASSASSGYASSAGCGLTAAGSVGVPPSASPQNGAAPGGAATVTIAAVLNSMMDRYVSLTNHLVLAHSFFDDAEKRCFELLEDARGDPQLDRFVALATHPLPLETHPLVLAEYARAALDFVAAAHGWPLAPGSAAAL